MEGVYGYKFERTATKEITIDDIGNCALEAIDREGAHYYLIILTSLGTTTVVKCGPIVPDVSLLPDGYTCSLERMDYDDDDIDSIIDKWTTGTKKKSFEEITIVDKSIAINNIRDLKNYLLNYSDEVY